MSYLYRILNDDDTGVANQDVSGTGTASTLPMSDEERAEAAKQEKARLPVGFVAPKPKRKR